MRPASIANYLDHLGQDRPDRNPPKRDNSPFRPRSLNSPQRLEPRPAAPLAVARAAPEAGAQLADRGPPSPLDRRRPAAPAKPVESLVAREAAKAEEMAARLAEAYERGREEGRRDARAKLEELRAADGAAAQELVEAERIAFQLNQYAQLEGTIRAGFAEIGENIGAAVARILAPFLAGEVVKYATDELCKNVARLCAGRSSGLITIRGPEGLLSPLRQRMPDLPTAVEYVEDNGVEAVVEANPTQIVTELRPWADLLASLDP
jgi:hypothetical protein